MTTTQRAADSATDIDVCEAIAREVLWLSTAIVDAANAPARKDPDDIKIGEYQASSASMVTS